MAVTDLSGNRYGNLLVLNYKGRSSSGCYMWLCKCDCGEETVVSVNHLKNGHTISCGCVLISKRKQGLLHKTHGGSKTRLYRIWKSMRRRCNSPTATRYEDWGGRGIAVCEEWNNFEIFRGWALSHGYTDNLSIDRINNDGNYEPSNCRWATAKEQSNNRRARRTSL